MDPSVREIYEIAIQTTGGEELARAAASLKTANTTIRQTQAAAAGFSRATDGIAKSSSKAAYTINQLSMQSGDFFVQIAGGQDALRAFSQQLPQVLGLIRGIGPAMAIGLGGVTALIAALPLLVAAYKSWAGASLTTAEALEKLNEAMSNQASAATAAKDFTELTKQLGAATTQTQALADAQLKLFDRKVAEGTTAAIASLRGELEGIERVDFAGSILAAISPLGDFADTYANTFNRIQNITAAMLTTAEQKTALVNLELAKFQEQMGISFTAAQGLLSALDQFEGARGLSNQAREAAELKQTLLDMANQKVDPAARLFAENIIAAEGYLEILDTVIKRGNEAVLGQNLVTLMDEGAAASGRMKLGYSQLSEQFLRTADDYAAMVESINSGEIAPLTEEATEALRKSVYDMGVELTKASPLFTTIAAKVNEAGEGFTAWQEGLRAAAIETAKVTTEVDRIIATYAEQERAARLVLQYRNDELGLLQAQQDAEVEKLKASEAFTKATKAQQDAMLKAARASNEAALSVAKMKASLQDASAFTARLASIAGGPLVSAFNAAAGAAGRVAGAVSTALTAFGQLQSQLDGLELDTALAEFEGSALAAGKSTEEIAAGLAGIRAQQETINRLAPVMPDWLAKAAGEAARAKTEVATLNLELIKSSNEAARAAREAATAGGGGGAIEEQADAIKEAMDVINQALEDSLTPAEKVARQQEELAAAMQLAAGAGLLNADQIERLGRYLQNLGKDAETATEQIKDIAGSGLNSMFDDLVDGAASVEQAFAEMVQSVLADIAKMLLSRQVQSLLNILGGAFGGAGSIFNTPIAPSTLSATRLVAPTPANIPAPLGDEWASARGVPVRLVNAGGALMSAPVVQAAPSNIVINNTMADVAEVTVTETNQNGERMIDIVFERKMREVLQRGTLDRTLAQSYGIKRRPG